MGDLEGLKAALLAAMRIDGGSPGGALSAVAAVGAEALPGDGAAVTLMSTDAQRQTLAATNDVVAAIEVAQYSLGEGPSLDALTTARPVLVPDLTHGRPQAAWPVLANQLAGLPVAALFAFPMRLGATSVGVALSYRATAGRLDRDEVAFALRATQILTLTLLEIREQHAGPNDEGDLLGDGRLGDWQVHQATGMLMVQLGGVTSLNAFARLRAYTFAHEHSLEQVAADIVAGRLILEPDDGTPT
ncbi:MAG TPA: GAF and ANTAR domain-containing protein [Nocardioidaceae bacterium]|nr:GAF and ANTAR domain-containing protein [Nocardioidaceae bacterium]